MSIPTSGQWYRCSVFFQSSGPGITGDEPALLTASQAIEVYKTITNGAWHLVHDTPTLVVGVYQFRASAQVVVMLLVRRSE